MRFDLSEEQGELVDILTDLLEQRSGSAEVRRAMESAAGYDEELWRTLAEEIGAASLAIPEEFGGAGFTRLEQSLVLERLGAALTPSPYLGSVAIAASALVDSGDAAAAARLLPAVADGSAIAALAWADPRGRWAPSAVDLRYEAERGTVTGEVPLVLEGGAASVVLAIAQTVSGPVLVEVTDPGAIERIPTPALDPTLRFATLRFAGTPAGLLAVGAEEEWPAVLDRIRDRALVAICAEQIGVAERGLAMTVEYSKQRVQFGRPIGSFQALKHRMADMHVRLETARTASRAASWANAVDDPALPELAAVAKAWCSDALDLIAAETVQLHGGIAITWEHDAQLVFKRAHALAQLFGPAAVHRARLAATALGL